MRPVSRSRTWKAPGVSEERPRWMPGWPRGACVDLVIRSTVAISAHPNGRKGSMRGGEVVMLVDECGAGIAPIFDVGVAGEKERADALADEADGSFGDAVELMQVCGCERAGNGGGVAEFEEPRGDRTSSPPLSECMLSTVRSLIARPALLICLKSASRRLPHSGASLLCFMA
eukprot:6207611-Prymnesium_polylepis.3